MLSRMFEYFEDYVPGSVYEYGPIAVEEEEVVSFATRFDPQVLHIDKEGATKGPFGGLIASGWHTVSLLMRLYVDHYVSPIASLSSPGVDEVRWPRPVRPGDELRLRVTVTEARRSRTKPDRGLVHTLLEGLNQDGELVCSMKAMNLFGVRPASGGG